MDADYNELRVLEVLVDERGTPTALRIEAIWGSTQAGAEPLVWNRTSFVAAAVGPLAGAEVGDRLELRRIVEAAGNGTAPGR